jgi:hypothetical protein
LSRIKENKGVKSIKMEYIILSELVGLSIMGHGTKYK